MTLNKYLELHPGVRGKLGCKDGVAFLVVGEITREKIKAADELILADMEATYKRYEQANEDRLMRQARFNIKNYIPLLKREVIEEYESIIGDGIILLIPGKERGRYWTCEDNV